MKIVSKTTALFALLALTALSCEKDDGGGPVVRDRGEEAIRAQEEIEGFLKTHFYNYEDFESPTEDFDYRIVFDSVTGDNEDKVPLFEHENLRFKEVVDSFDTDVTYKLYYLVTAEGIGAKPSHTDTVMVHYEGLHLDRSTFDGAVFSPVRFNLNTIIRGVQQLAVELEEGEVESINEDGTIDFANYGVGAVFVPSGLGYFNQPVLNSGVLPYEQLIFTVQLLKIASEDGDEQSLHLFPLREL